MTAETPRLLIVDDVPQNLQVLAGILAPFSGQLSAATDGPSALELAREAPPDLILLDVTMPEMDGFEVCRQLQADPRTREVPVIFLTARTQSEDIVRGFEAGAVDYVNKPFHPPELLARVRTHLALKGALDRERAMRLELEAALANIKVMSGLIPICARCMKVREDSGYWTRVEAYVSARSGATFSHGVCPECTQALYPEFSQDQGLE